MQIPDRITAMWIRTLDDGSLMDVECHLHREFATLEREEKRIRGSRYELARGSAPLLDAWQRWSLLNNATRERGLHPRLVR